MILFRTRRRVQIPGGRRWTWLYSQDCCSSLQLLVKVSSHDGFAIPSIWAEYSHKGRAWTCKSIPGGRLSAIIAPAVPGQEMDPRTSFSSVDGLSPDCLIRPCWWRWLLPHKRLKRKQATLWWSLGTHTSKHGLVRTEGCLLTSPLQKITISGWNWFSFHQATKGTFPKR